MFAIKSPVIVFKLISFSRNSTKLRAVSLRNSCKFSCDLVIRGIRGRISKPIANINVTAYTGNAATERILPTIIFSRGIRSKAETLIVTASVPILGSPDAPAARKKTRVGKVVLEPVNVCVNTGLIPRCRNLTAEGLCDRCELRGIVKWRPLGRTIGICFLLFQVIVNGKGGRMTLKGT